MLTLDSVEQARQDDLPWITNDEDWLDLDIGEEALVQGKLTHVSKDGLVITFNDWSQLAIETTNGPMALDYAGRTVSLVVERTEDGVKATGASVLAIQEIEQ